MRCPGRSPFFKGECFKFGVAVFHSPNAVLWGFPKRVPIIRIIVFWGLHWGPPIHGSYQMLYCSGHRLMGLRTKNAQSCMSAVSALLTFIGMSGNGSNAKP